MTSKEFLENEMQYRDIKVLHLEPTNVCQASCPQCARETVKYFDPEPKQHFTLSQAHSIFPEKFIENLDKMFMCGTYGEPAAGKDTFELYQYFRQINPSIELGLNTNGGVRNTQWWSELGALFSQGRNYAVFSIDGLKDTNHIYRIGVDFDKVIENARAFIAAGGNASWEMLVFKHNEHQVEECRQMAKDLGFNHFSVKVTRRPLKNNLELPIHFSKPKSITNPSKIDCMVMKDNSIYMSYTGAISPCCWIGAHDFVDNIKMSDVDGTWDTPSPNRHCLTACGVSDDSSKNIFLQQWKNN